MLTLIAAVIIFGLLIFCHEFGHFIVAKKTGIGVIEFAVGFGPKIFSFKRGETVYSLRAFPLGGFNRMADDMEEESPASFNAHPVWKRFITIAAGPLMNFLLTVLFFSLLYYAFLGVPDLDSTVIGELLPDGRAVEAGLQKNDRIIAINGEQVSDWQEVVNIIHSHPEEEITIAYERDGVVFETDVIPKYDEQTGAGMIGIQVDTRKYSFFASLRLGINNTVWLIRFMVASIARMITGRAPADVVGPVGIIRIVGEAARMGTVNLINLAAIISLNFGIINLLPFPALDGSRLIFLAIEGLRGRPINRQVESIIHLVGFAFLMILMIVIAYRDIINFSVPF